MTGGEQPRTQARPTAAVHGTGSSLETAILLLSRGDPDGALRAASEACHDDPQQPQAHYVYGQAWLALHKPAQAERAFAEAIQLAPDWADAWLNYGVARYQQGATDDAKVATRQALLRAPGHPSAIANLAAFMRITGEASENDSPLQAAVMAQPDNAAARLNLVADLMLEDRVAEALAVLDSTQSSDPRTLRHWHLQRTGALVQLGRLDEARRQLDAFADLGECPPEFASLWHWRLVVLASAEGDSARASQEAERMEVSLASHDITATREHVIMGHFNLAKFWSNHNHAERAMRHWTLGHALLKPTQPFLRDKTEAFVEANVVEFNEMRFASGPRAGNADPAPVFIVGMPRSGTTLCEQILAAHAAVHGAGERAALRNAFVALGGADDEAEAVRRIAGLETPALDHAAKLYLEQLHGLAPDKQRVVDKMPGNYNLLGLVGLMLPAAKIIQCVRDPRDIGLSIFTYRFHGYHPYAHDLADIGWTIAQHIRLMDHWRQVLPNQILRVALADWVHDFEGTLDRVLTHLALPPDPNCARFYEADRAVRTVSRAQVRQPVNARGLERWRGYAEQLQPLVSALQEAGIRLD